MSKASVVKSVIDGLIKGGVSVTEIRSALDGYDNSLETLKVAHLKSMFDSDYDLGDIQDVSFEMGIPKKETKALKKSQLVNLILENKSADEIATIINGLYPEDPVSFDSLEGDEEELDEDEDEGEELDDEDEDEDEDDEDDEEDDDYDEDEDEEDDDYDEDEEEEDEELDEDDYDEDEDDEDSDGEYDDEDEDYDEDEDDYDEDDEEDE